MSVTSLHQYLCSQSKVPARCRQVAENRKCHGEVQEETRRKCRSTEEVKGIAYCDFLLEYIIDAMQALEEENSSLVDKNAALEGEIKKASALKPLLDSYKHQISEMETRNSSRNKEIDTLKFELEQTRTLLRIADEERAKDSETIDLFQERIRELELSTAPPEKLVKSPSANGPPGDSTEFTEAELTGHSPDDADRGLGAELDDAESGRTMTKMKIELRQLKAELESAKSNQGNNSDILVLKSLLEDSNRLKARYEEENLAVHRENLVLQKNLEDIRSGKALGDG